MKLKDMTQSQRDKMNEIAAELWIEYAAKGGYKIQHVENTDARNVVIVSYPDVPVIAAFCACDGWTAWSQHSYDAVNRMVEHRLKGFTFDWARPQAWFDERLDEIREAERQGVTPPRPPNEYVWLYDDKAGMCGRLFHIFGEEDPFANYHGIKADATH